MVLLGLQIAKIDCYRAFLRGYNKNTGRLLHPLHHLRLKALLQQLSLVLEKVEMIPLTFSKPLLKQVKEAVVLVQVQVLVEAEIFSGLQQVLEPVPQLARGPVQEQRLAV